MLSFDDKRCLQYNAWIWGGIGAMILSAVVLNAGVILALTYQSGSPVHDRTRTSTCFMHGPLL